MLGEPFFREKVAVFDAGTAKIAFLRERSAKLRQIIKENVKEGREKRREDAKFYKEIVVVFLGIIAVLLLGIAGVAFRKRLWRIRKVFKRKPRKLAENRDNFANFSKDDHDAKKFVKEFENETILQ